ncbi:aminoglycoside 6'-N-acetyltransferase [Solilutibacter silvestris]|uniref:Aminoglycoside N(6')-acetyltransferase type 1 n=1 Tax=Solilutibacter silvestris TaxID=1645665 RepID=A0A2K1PXC8_9GAMM|nr:aminoglycoside 6'-N-acetyltransferase [Lysobacter silvestris]PNS07448.1 Acetyltransferase (GNAT) family [Lysobacter silvestris]
MSDGWTLRPATPADFAAWGALRARLWDDSADIVAEHDDMRTAIDPARPATTFLAVDHDGRPFGFIEVAIRHDYVNGSESSPVGFIEGWYVEDGWQGRGIGRALVDAAAAWTRARGRDELCSDAMLDADESHAAHRACGFEETERVVYFRKPVTG